MSSPVVTVEVAFATDPGAVTPTWADVTDQVLDIQIRRGRVFELDTIGPGTCTVTFEDPKRNLDPTYTVGAYYPNVLPMRRIRVTAVFSAVTYRVFSGYVERWPITWSGPDYSRVTVTASDGFLPLQQAALVVSRSAEMSGTRVGAVLDAVGWPTADRVIDTGASTIQASTFVATDNQTALQHIQAVVMAENGLFFIDGQGRAVFQDRHRRLTTPYTTSNITFTDSNTTDATHLAYRDLAPSFDADHLYNEVNVTRTGGTTQTAFDATSQTRYYRRTLNLTPLITTDVEALSAAQWLLYRYKDAQLRFDSVTLDGFTDDNLWPQLLGREISDRITVVRTPATHPVTAVQTITKDVFIEAVTHSITPAVIWTTSYQLSPVDSQQFWVLGDAIASLLGQTTVLSY